MTHRAHGTGDSRTSLLLQLRDEPGALEAALHPFAVHGVNLTHIESRPRRGRTFDFFVDCDGEPGDPGIDAVISDLEHTAARLLVLGGKSVPWFPRDIADLDVIAGRTLEAGSDLKSDHPGFSDPVYRARRKHIDGLARSFHHGDEVPNVEYSAKETETWGVVYQKLVGLHEQFACTEYRRAFRLMETHCGYAPDNIPQGREVSAFLESRTGFRLRPVAGLLGSRDFLNGLAFRIFLSTQYIRHASRPLYTPEPDVCHELIGHAPMFADSAFADLSQEIGLASLGASDEEIIHLARCYWHSVEFGLLRDRGKLKAYGAGLLSSFGELAHACASDAPRLLPWEPVVAARQEFPITEYQPVYFVASSLVDARDKIHAWCRELPRPFYARYNATTERIWVDRAVRRGDDP